MRNARALQRIAIILAVLFALSLLPVNYLDILICTILFFLLFLQSVLVLYNICCTYSLFCYLFLIVLMCLMLL